MDNRNNYKNSRRPIKREGVAVREVAEGIVYGRNQVRELLKSERAVDKIYLRKGDREGSVLQIIAMASEKGIPIVDVEREKLLADIGTGASIDVEDFEISNKDYFIYHIYFFNISFIYYFFYLHSYHIKYCIHT